MDAGFGHQRVGHHLEALGVDLVAERLALGHGCTHLVRALLELAADAVGFDRLLVAVPGQALDAHSGEVAAVAAEALDQGHVHAGACRCQCRGEARRAGSDDEHVGAMDDVDLARGLGDGAEALPLSHGRTGAAPGRGGCRCGRPAR